MVTEGQQGDEIYLSITEFHSSRDARHITVPSQPVHWPSKALPQVKDLRLWGGSLKEGESLELIISVIEQDAAPWNIDDLIGTVKVKLRNENGKLEEKWKPMGEGTEHSASGEGSGASHTINFKGRGHYEIQLQLRK